MKPDPDKLDTVAGVFFVVAVVLFIWPLKIFGRGAGTTLQVYQDAKGSWVPAAVANANPVWFFLPGVGLAIAAVFVLSVSKWIRMRGRKP